MAAKVFVHLYNFFFEIVMEKSQTLDDYIARQPAEAQPVLRLLCDVVRRTAPEAAVKISYGMPAFMLKKRPLVYFGAHSRHIGFYPTPSGVDAFKNELQGFRHTKGGIQLPYDEPPPLSLIARIVEFRVKEVTNSQQFRA